MLSYHWYGPPGAVAVRVAAVLLQMVTDDAVGGAGGGKSVTVTVVDELGQPPNEVITV